MSKSLVGCTLKTLPSNLAVSSAKIAVSQNPANRPAFSSKTSGVLTPQFIALVTSKYWGAGGVKLGVTFLDTQDTSLKSKILSHMNAWNKWANVTFSESSQGQVRLARTQGDGYWSYLGTDILSIPVGQPTMNLDSFSLSTADSEYARVVRHETGHTLGCPHEHMRKEIVARIDPVKAKAYFLQMDGWDAQTVQEQVLTPLDDSTLMETPPDVTSIMCYDLPASIMTDGIAVPGGMDIDASDGAFMAKMYPQAGNPPPPSGGSVIDQVNAAFAAIEAQYARYPTMVRILKQVNKMVDDYLQQHPQHARMANGTIPQPVLEAISKAFDAAGIMYPQYAPAIMAVKPLIMGLLGKI